MEAPEGMFALGAWLGAIRDRLRAGRSPAPGCSLGRSETRWYEAIKRHRKSYGLQWLALNREWAGRKIEPIAILDEYITEIHALARGKFYERSLWEELLSVVPSPLPMQVAHDLVDRDIEVCLLGHRFEYEAVLWRVSDRVVEAVYNLAILRYTNEHDGPDRLEEIFYQFPYWLEVGAILAAQHSGTPEKLKWFVAKMKEHKLPVDRPRIQMNWNPEFREKLLNSAGDQ